MQMVKLHEIIVKDKVTPTLWKIVVFNEICSEKKFWELNYGQLLYIRAWRASKNTTYV
jgi:hypothetical protein